MGRVSYKKSLYKYQERSKKGTFAKKKQKVNEENTIDFSEDDVCDDVSDIESGWEEDESLQEVENRFQRLQKLGLFWTSEANKNIQKSGPYKTGKCPKSTYYDKYGPSGSFTKAAKGTTKITSFWNNSMQEIDNLDNLDEESMWETEEVNEKKENLKKELMNPSKMDLVEYNKKRAIFEYLKRLDNAEKGKLKASKEAAQLVFLESVPHKSKLI